MSSAAAFELPAHVAAEYPFEPRRLDLGGVEISYLDEGPREGESVLFLHGNPTWSFLWRAPILALRERYRCVASDHVGCGLSDKPQDYPYRLERHVANVEALADSLGLERVTLCVHDWGGPIGFGFAARRPERIARLIVLNTAAFPGPAPLRIRACRTPLVGPLAVRGLNAFARLATVMAVERELPKAVHDGYLAPYGSWDERVATLRFVEDIPLSPAHPSWSALIEIERSLAHLADRPACLIWGERDWCFTPHYRREWQRRFPKAEVHVADDAGHLVVEDARERVVEWMRSFLAAHPL